MSRNLLSIIAVFVFALTAAGCSSIGTDPLEMPSMGSPFTEVGNPEEEEAQLKGIYINDEFDVRIEYPLTWDVDERGTDEVEFFSELDESVTASFVWLDEGQGFDDFLLDVRGGQEGLKTYTGTAFDLSKCNIDEVEEMISVECYHFTAPSEGRGSVVILTGFVLTKTGVAAVTASPITENKQMSKSPGYSHTSPIAAADSDESSEDNPYDAKFSISGTMKFKKPNLRRQHLEEAALLPQAPHF